MPKGQFKVGGTHLPVTMEQFQDLTNEILVEINKLSKPHFLEADYVAQIVMSAIHAMDHKIGYVKKQELLASCINRISCHVTYHAVQEIQARIKAKAAEAGQTVTEIDSESMAPVEAKPAEVLQ
jgi:hypothetical protein